jgi:predicted PurR-regulated permease PerM
MALRTVLITLGLIGIAVIVLYLLRNFASALLLIFAGILFGIFLNALTNLGAKRLHLPRWLALTLLLVVIVGGGVLFIWLAGPQVVQQMQQLAEQLPKSLSKLRDQLERHDWGRTILSNLPSLDKMNPSLATLMGSVTQFFSITLEVLGAIVFVFFVGLYLAAGPREYLDPLLLLFSPEHRERGHEIVAALGGALGWWLFGRAVTMSSLGILTTIALWLFGIPLALVLGIIAGLLLFVPYLGAIAAAIPAMLVALVQSPEKAFWVGCIYTGVHVFEGYCITPFVQRRAVALPPGLLISVQILSASLFGIGGVVFSTPLTVVAIVLVQMLYVQNVLGERVAVLGDHEPHKSPP